MDIWGEKSEAHFLLTIVFTQVMWREMMMTVHMTVSWSKLERFPKYLIKINENMNKIVVSKYYSCIH